MIKDLSLLSVIFLLLDSIYLFIMKDNFNKLVFSIQKSKLNLNIFFTLLCYIFLIFLIYYFIIIKNNSLLDAFLLGIATYGVYETTNIAIFDKWNINIGFIDIIWGGILFLMTTYIFRYINKIF